MEKSVGSVDLDELLKARQELNSERGVETDPDMYKNYNPNRKNEEAAAQSESEQETEELAEAIEDGEIPLEDTISDEEIVPEQVPEDTPTDFSAYDNFAAFEISNDQEEPAESVEVSPSDDDELADAMNQNSSEAIGEQNSSTQETSQTSAPSTHSSSNGFNLEDYVVDNGQSTIGNFGGGRQLTEQDLANAEAILTGDSTPVESTATTPEEEIQKYLDQLSLIIGETDSNMAESTPAEEEGTTTAAANGTTDSTSDEDLSEEELDLNALPSFDSSSTQTSVDGQQAEQPQTAANLPVAENPAPNLENNSTELEKFTKSTTDADADSENKIMDILSRLGSDKGKGAQSSNGYYREIKDVDFIDAVGSDAYATQEKFAYVLGRNEDGEYEFSTLKSMYNLAMFSSNESDTFNLMNSVMLSMMLKNTNENLNFYICDTKQASVFDIYAKSSYLVSPIAKSQEDILSLLAKISAEIDSRYESIATSGTKSIEEYNEAMSKSYFTELPYSLLIFNNYHLAEYMDSSKKINEVLSYILKFGRLVGVYVYVLAENEIKEDSVNYNLSSRISFRAETEEESIKKVSLAGAEKLSGKDDYVLKTINMETVKHLKAPKISKREVELLIENIEG